jgi:hypothetical protein
MRAILALAAGVVVAPLVVATQGKNGCTED